MVKKIENAELVKRISALRQHRLHNGLSYRDFACLGHTTIVKIAQMEHGVCESLHEMRNIVTRIENSAFVGA